MDVSSVILGTGSYDNVKRGNKVSISGDGGNSAGFFGPSYRRLSPRLETFNTYAEKRKELLKLKDDISRAKEYYEYKKQIEDEYIQSFYDLRLKLLDIDRMVDYLKKKHGRNVILLCYEPIEEFCHRRLVADYIELMTGTYIPEVSIDEYGNVKKLEPIRYKKRLAEAIYR